jgi:hypothetical protein
MTNRSGGATQTPWFDMAPTTPPVRPQRPLPAQDDACVLPPLRPTTAVMPPGANFQDSVPQQTHNRVHESFFGSAAHAAPPAPAPAPVPEPVEPGGGEWAGVRPLEVDETRSSITCLRCGETYLPHITVHFVAAGKVAVQGEGYSFCCRGPEAPSEPEDAPESGVRLRGEGRSDDNEAP